MTRRERGRCCVGVGSTGSEIGGLVSIDCGINLLCGTSSSNIYLGCIDVGSFYLIWTHCTGTLCCTIDSGTLL